MCEHLECAATVVLSNSSSAALSICEDSEYTMHYTVSSNLHPVRLRGRNTTAGCPHTSSMIVTSMSSWSPGVHAGTAVTKANRAAKHTKVAVPFKVPDPQEPVGHTRAPKQPVGQHKHSLKLSAPHDPAAASQAAAAAPLADPIKHELPPKPRPHTAQKGGHTASLFNELVAPCS